MKQIDILNHIVEGLHENKKINGIMLMGSVADGTATETSDLDIMILCDKDKFEANFIDNILVEYTYIKYDTALYKLQNKEMDVYHYINSKILYDNGKLQELMLFAQDRYKNFITKTQAKKDIYYWLVSLKIKLQSSMNRNDVLKTNFLTATNSWKLIEAVWAINNKPMPPSGSVIKFLDELTITPYEKWFEKIFYGNDSERSTNMMDILLWVLPRLKENQE